MDTPAIGLKVEPSKDFGPVRYLMLPPATPGGPPIAQLSFEVRFTNNAPQAVKVTMLRLRFDAATGLPHHDIMIKTESADGKVVTAGLWLQPGQTLAPRGFRNTDNLLIDGTPPAEVLFEVHADGFAHPKNHRFDLARYDPPLPPGYDWPGHAADLARGEYWRGIGANHCCGHQLFAHDLGVEFFDLKTLQWTPLHPRKSGKKNAHYRVWGKPIYAMADGTVQACNATEEDDNPKPPTVPDSASTLGNHFVIDHGGVLMYYAHFQFGTRPVALVTAGAGASVKRGDFLGRVGNSGNSHGAHLHIHAVGRVDKCLRPIPWQRKRVVRQPHQLPVQGDDWQFSENQGLPVVNALIYPGSATPADPFTWSDWRTLGGVLVHGVTVCAWGPQRLDVFGVSTDRALYHRWWNGRAWSVWENLGGTLTSAPAAVSWGPNRIDVFARGSNNELYQLWFDGHWHGWHSLGGTLLSAPAVSSRRANHLDVFVQATNNELYHRWWNGQSWSIWESLGGQLTSAPSAVSWSSTRIDVFARGAGDMLWQRVWDGKTWLPWGSRGKRMKYAPAVTSRRSKHLDVFVVASDDTLHHTMWKGDEWWRWESLGGHITETPAAVARGSKRIDVFGRGTDNALYQTFWRQAP